MVDFSNIKKIGILGGSFDPIHHGHLRLALDVKQQLQLDEVHLMPAAHPPHRTHTFADKFHRLNMVKLAIQYSPELICNDIEYQREGPSYMIDTLSELIKIYPGQSHRLYLILGEDAFSQLNLWHRWESLLDYTSLIIIKRLGVITKKAWLKTFITAKAEQLHFLSSRYLQISATEIRQLLAKNQNPQFLLPESVLNYIRAEKLYQEYP